LLLLQEPNRFLDIVHVSQFTTANQRFRR
jgi:hypothetical protein